MTFAEDVHVPQRMEPNDLMTPTSGVTFLAFIEIFQHILDGSTQTLVQTFIMNDYHFSTSLALNLEPSFGSNFNLLNTWVYMSSPPNPWPPSLPPPSSPAWKTSGAG